MDFKEFRDTIKKNKGPRIHKITNSYGVRDGFNYYRKLNLKSSKHCLTRSEYFKVIRMVNQFLANSLIEGDDITFPARMGKLELRKYKAQIKIDNEKIKTNLPIDWNRTLKLWYEDEESYKNKTLVKMEEREIYKIYYNKNIANYRNKSFYQFNINRDLKRKLKENIVQGNIDAFSLK